MSQPSNAAAPTGGRNPNAPTAPPPNPKVQAVDFALQLAGINATVKPQDIATAQKIVDDAQTIATFLGGTVS